MVKGKRFDLSDEDSLIAPAKRIRGVRSEIQRIPAALGHNTFCSGGQAREMIRNPLNGLPSKQEGASFPGSILRVLGFQPVSLATSYSIAAGSSKAAHTFIGPDQVNGLQ